MYDLIFYHNSKTCTDPNCRCRTQRNTSSIPDNATILSVKKTLVWDTPISRTALEAALRTLFLELSRFVLSDGIVLGHLKGVLKTGTSMFSVSVTREDSIDESQNASWTRMETVACSDLTVNLLSILPCELSNDDLDARITAMHTQLACQLSPLPPNS